MECFSIEGVLHLFEMVWFIPYSVKRHLTSVALNIFFVNIYPPLLKVKKVCFYNGPEAKPRKN